MSHVFAPNEQLTKSLTIVCDNIAKRTNGAIEIQQYPQGQLATYKDGVEQVVQGAKFISVEDPSYLGDYVADFNALVGPMLYSNFDQYEYLIRTDLVKRMIKEVEDKHRIKVLALDYIFGFRSLMTNKVIKTPADLKGMKIRVQPSPTAVKMVELLGANPTPIAFGELYTALQQGVVDGAENNESALVDNRHGEVSKFYSYDRHTMIPDVLVMSTKDWDKLTPEQQAAIKKAGRESMMLQKQLWAENTEKVIKEAKEKLGVTFVEDVDTAAFAAKVLPMHEEATKASPQAADLIKRIKEKAPK